MKPIFVTGHKNPDTDSIIGAICYANLKNIKDEANAVPCRLGDINAESRFVLERYNLDEPKLLKSVRIQLSDLDIDKVLNIKSDAPVKTAVDAMLQEGMASMTVVDNQGKLEGVVTFGDIARTDVRLSCQSSVLTTTLDNIASVLDGKVINRGAEDVSGKVKIIPTKEDIVSADGIAVVEYESGIEEAISRSGAELVVVCKGNGLGTVDGNASVVSTDMGLFATSRIISQSIPVSEVMVKENLISFGIDDYVDDVEEVMGTTRIRSFPVIDGNGVVIGVVSRNHLIKRNKKSVILVDHNEKAQTVDGIEQAVIKEVIDHHRVADFETMQPLYMRSEPVGSSNTIIASMYKEAGIVPDKAYAGAMLCGILSDTVLFKSPTCTQRDKDTAMYLAEITGENIDELGNDLFTAGSTLVQEGAKAMVGKDFKEFAMGDVKVGIGQITIWDTDLVLPVQDEIVAYMNELVKTKEYSMILFMETSIKKEGTLLVCAGDYEKTVEKAFGKKTENGQVYLEGVMSRKKQIVPFVQGALS